MRAAQVEFLLKGFKDASLRAITKTAGVTTGAFYGYFTDKAALFEALVEPAAGDLKRMYIEAQESFKKYPVENMVDMMRDYTGEHLQRFLDFVYRHFDAFKLIVCFSEGTPYSGYINSLIEIETTNTIHFFELLRQFRGGGEPVQRELIHILNTAYLNAVFETVRHDMPKQVADGYIGKLTAFFAFGWEKVFLAPELE
jgi:AcrR family transcriptional regulator